MAAAASTTTSTGPATPRPKSPAVASINGELLLSVDPDSANFQPTGGNSEHMLVNLSSERLAIKVRCSDNNLFRVNPVFMFIEPGQCTNLVVTRVPGPPKNDKIVLHFMKNNDPNAQIKELFKAANCHPEKLTIPLNCSLETEKQPVIGDEKK
uniref:Major sperm protein n=1 Tax=Panagrolaimus sp. JU765 TaxID=591449 RepID=A0AC34RI55_9BILA